MATTKSTKPKKTARDYDKDYPRIFARIPPELHARLKKLAERYAQRLLGAEPKMSHAIRAALLAGIGPAETEQDEWERQEQEKKSPRVKRAPSKKK